MLVPTILDQVPSRSRPPHPEILALAASDARLGLYHRERGEKIAAWEEAKSLIDWSISATLTPPRIYRGG